ncbi:MAG: MotA/TolQ/ExbB proton channel family protein [Verrucomicrobia bacterium]|nr:MotA/TolQ/ExbB proton channel family protein [Verrucomicrobiota bacterium]
MEGFTLWEMISRGWPVLSVLFIMSIASITIMVDRVQMLRKARVDARAFVQQVLDLHERRGRAGALTYCEQTAVPIARVMADVLRERGGREDLERNLARAIRHVGHKLEERIPYLGSIAGTAPFVGLLGTVGGIIRAFRDIARTSGGGPEVVSAGIAEALVTTSFGLIVAIPAVMAYNYFSSSIRRLETEWELAGSYLVDAIVEDEGAA